MADEAPAQQSADGVAVTGTPQPPNTTQGSLPAEGSLPADALDEMLSAAGSFTDPAGAGAHDDADAQGPAIASALASGPDALPDHASIEEMLRQATFVDPDAIGIDGGVEGGTSNALSAIDADPFPLPNFNQVIQDTQVSSIDLLRDVELNVKIELGRSRMLVEDVLRLAEGSVVELDKLAGDPVDVFVNERLVARGEVLVLNDNFCVRVNEIVPAAKDEGL